MGSGRTDVEVGDATEMLMTPGIEAPESDEGKMVVVAHQILTDVRGDGIEHFRWIDLGFVRRDVRGFAEDVGWDVIFVAVG